MSAARRRVAKTVAAALASLPILLAIGGTAHAALVPTAYGGTSSATLLNAEVTSGGVTLAGVRAGPSLVDVDSNGTPRSLARAANLAAALPGLPALQTLTQTAPPDNPAAATDTFPPVANPPLLAVAAISASAHARWLGDATCTPNNGPISQATTSTASARLLDVIPPTPSPIPGEPPVTLGGAGVATAEISTASTASLVPGAGGPTDARAVQSTATGSWPRSASWATRSTCPSRGTPP